MSNWDLGFGQEPTDDYQPRHAPQPGGPDGTVIHFGDTGWPGSTGWPGTDDFPGNDGEPYDPEDAPYPITYERDDFDGVPTAPPPGKLFGDLFGDPYIHGSDTTPALNLDGQPGDEPWRSGLGGPRWEPESRSGQPRWLVPAAVAAAAAVIGALLVLITSGHPSAPAASGAAKPTMMATSVASPTPAPRKTAIAAAPPLTLAAAESALNGYTTINNSANAQRSDSELAMVETGSSYAIDAGLYQTQRADGAAPYPAFGPAAATYYIPRTEPAGGPRWFVVRVANAFAAHPKKVTSTEYLLFTETAPGGTWRNTAEPYLLPGANAPQIAIGASGLATAVSATSASLAAAPGQLAGLTAASLDGAGSAVRVTDPGELADRSDRQFWQGKLPMASVTDTHAAAAGQTFALLTTNGGALVFYTDSAELTITPPAGSELRLTVPGLYSRTQAVNRAGLAYLDQFAAYDPPSMAGIPAVVAGYSGLTGKN
jgi:hypothetical protein